MLKKLIIVTSILSTTAACFQSPANSVNSTNSNGAAGSSESVNVNASDKTSENAPLKDVPKTKTFLGDLIGKRVEINLTRDGNNLSGTYKYEKVGADLKLSGTIDAAGNFTLQETGQAGNKTGEWKGIWKEDDGKATLTGKWKSPKGGDALDFFAAELKTEFAGVGKITTKSSHEENKTKFYEITAEYPELSGVDPAAANFNQSVKKIVDENINEFKKNLPDYTTPVDLERYKKDEIMLYDATTYDLETANDDLISVTLTDSSFGGGAHGSSVTTTLNFDVKNNRVLKLTDIFEPNSNYLKTLSDLSRADLKAKLQKGGMFDEEMLNPGVESKEENFKSWNLTKKGLLINFDAYQVAAYAAGPQIVIIPYAKLKNLLRKDGAAASLIK